MATDDQTQARRDGRADRVEAGKRRPSAAEQRDARADVREAALDARQDLADARETSLDARQDRADLRESAETDRENYVQSVLRRAETRDGRADDRDSLADTRDESASLDSFLHDEQFLIALRARRLAALDRLDSKTDRTSSATDRSNLTDAADHVPTTTPSRHLPGGPQASWSAPAPLLCRAEGPAG